jgi:hypothetical protein
MRQVIYVSTACSSAYAIDPSDILEVSARNNRRDGITGLLYSDSKRFLQALEGDEAKVAAALARIEKDPRHRAVVVLSDRMVSEREFGEWSMAHRAAGSDAEAFVRQVAERVATASPSVRATFEGFAELRRAA